MNKKINNICSNCNSDEFITIPNQYDILRFRNGEFAVERTEFIDECKIFCRECNAEVDEIESEKFNRVVLKKDE